MLMVLELLDGNHYTMTYSISYRACHGSTVGGSETTRLTLCIK